MFLFRDDMILYIENTKDSSKKLLKLINSWDFPGGAVVKTPPFQCRGLRFKPWSGN